MITNLYQARKRSDLTEDSLTNTIQVMTDTYDKPKIGPNRGHPCLPKNSSKSTLLLLLRGGVSQKVKVLICVDHWRCPLQWPGFNIYTQGLTMSPGRIGAVTNLEKKTKTSYFKIT